MVVVCGALKDAKKMARRNQSYTTAAHSDPFWYYSPPWQLATLPESVPRYRLVQPVTHKHPRRRRAQRDAVMCKLKLKIKPRRRRASPTP